MQQSIDKQKSKPLKKKGGTPMSESEAASGPAPKETEAGKLADQGRLTSEKSQNMETRQAAVDKSRKRPPPKPLAH